MYCPNCSQQQVSEEVRFCSRCGFPLGAVRELLAQGAGLVERAAPTQGNRPPPPLGGVRQGAWMMLASLPAALVVALLSAIDEEFAVLLLLPLLCFVAGFARLLYATFLAKSAPRVKGETAQPHITSEMPAQLGAAARRPELSPPRVVPPESFTAQRVKTAEMAQPPSVTEHTTRLLDEEADSRRG